MNIELILFDWGGTLADVSGQIRAFQDGATEAADAIAGPDAEKAVERLIDAVRTAETNAARDPELIEANLSRVVEQWLNSLDGPVRVESTAEAVGILGRAWIGALEPMPGALEAVQTLRDRGYRMGLVSNCMIPPPYATEELTRQGYGPLLDFAILSCMVGYRKPAPQFYQAALTAAFPDNPPTDLSHVLFVGDSPGLDVVAPAALGMKTALVAAPQGAWPAEDYARAKPDFHLDAVADLPALLAS